MRSTPLHVRHLIVAVLAFAALQLPGAPPDLLVVGAGISGLAAAAEGARHGLRVTVVDRQSIYGGVAVNAYGVAIIGSPLQEQLGIEDSEDLAAGDFVSWGGDPDPYWVRHYVRHSRTGLFDWFSDRGVEFERVAKVRGNSVARFHFPRGGIVTMVQALYREIQALGGVEFVMSSDVTGLVLDGGRVAGVRVRDYRSGSSSTILAKNVLLATGGFQNNKELVLRFWPSQSGAPERILLGGGLEAVGSGFDLVRPVGAKVANMDRQWNYVPGVPMPDDPSAMRGIYLDFSGPIWVNTQGRRFINEGAEKSVRLDTLAVQEHSTAWMIFDSTLRPAITLVHPVFNTEPTKSNVLRHPGLLLEAQTIEELAEKAGLPAGALVEAVGNYNRGFESGQDEFGRRLQSNPAVRSPTRPITEAPFFAIQIYPITRKSMGGIQVDQKCRVIAESGRAVPGLYASGEATGMGGVNGRQSLEGTFIGAGILMGRVAARSIADSKGAEPQRSASGRLPGPVVLGSPDPALDAACLDCHNLPVLISPPRPGFRHFELSHRIVLERSRSCQECHADLSPHRPEAHKIDRLLLVGTCNACHSLGP